MGERVGSLRALLRGGQLRARAAAVVDSRALVRVLFLAAAVQLDVLELLRAGCTVEELCGARGWNRPDRVAAWLRVGVETRELRERGGRFTQRGARFRALAGGDEVLRAHYRSVLEYQDPSYATLAQSFTGTDRGDLARYAGTIATVSRAAEPFLLESVARVARGTPGAARILDVGCGTGVYLAAALRAAPQASGLGVDLASDALAITARHLDASELAGLARGAGLVVETVSRPVPTEPFVVLRARRG